MKNVMRHIFIITFASVLVSLLGFSGCRSQKSSILKNDDVKNISASSFLFNDSQWHHTHVMDGKAETIWVADDEEDGRGEWVQIDLREKFVISKIGIINGNLRNREAYAKNHQIKDMLIIFSDGSKKKVSLQKSPELQYIAVNNITADSIRFEVESTFPGTKFKHTCISEIEMHHVEK